MTPGSGAPPTDAEVVRFLQWALPRLELRWRGFRKVRGQVRKRLARRLAELGCESLAQYRERLASHPDEWAALDSMTRITISRFYRDRGVFDRLRDGVLPDLAARAREAGRRHLRAWSVGCASGEEPYTLALVWRFAVAPRFPELDLVVTGTDIDPHMIARARDARYPPGSLRELPETWRATAFVPAGCGAFELRAAWRAGVRFAVQDIRRDSEPGPFDLVACRNLALTYFGERLQEEVLARIVARLRPGGVLLVGTHEAPPAVLPLVALRGGGGLWQKR